EARVGPEGRSGPSAETSAEWKILTVREVGPGRRGLRGAEGAAAVSPTGASERSPEGASERAPPKDPSAAPYASSSSSSSVPGSDTYGRMRSGSKSSAPTAAHRQFGRPSPRTGARQCGQVCTVTNGRLLGAIQPSSPRTGSDYPEP